MRLFVTVVVAMVLFVGCGGGSEAEAPVENETSEETSTVAQIPPQTKVADSIPKTKAAANWSRPTYEVRDVRPGRITSTDLSFGNADVFLSDFGGRPYGIMRNDPVLQEIADEIRADNPEYEMMLVSVYSGTEKREDRFMSNWYAFESPAVEQEFMADFESNMDEAVQEFKEKQQTSK